MASVKQIAQKQKITDFDGEDRDIMALAMDDGMLWCRYFLCVREG